MLVTLKLFQHFLNKENSKKCDCKNVKFSRCFFDKMSYITLCIKVKLVKKIFKFIALNQAGKSLYMGKVHYWLCGCQSAL